MKRIGLTGGIGSGKSMVAELLQLFGIPVYNSDFQSKQLCERHPVLVAGLTQLLGEGIYNSNGKLNRSLMAELLFSNKQLLEACNSLIHPIVAQDFIEWSQRQQAAFVVQESAILFEAKLDNLFDVLVCVTAPEDVRIERVCSRSGMSVELVKSRMSNQWPEAEKIKRSNFILVNDGQTPLIPQVELLLKRLC